MVTNALALLAVISVTAGCARGPAGEGGGQPSSEGRLVQLSGRRSLLPLPDEKGKFGYSSRSGRTSIAATFGMADEFVEGRALVCVGECKYVERTESDSVTVHEFQGKFGFIDEKGAFVGDPQFDSG